MESREVEKRLQAITHEYLSDTCYSTADVEKSQVEQFKLISTALIQLQADFPCLLDTINSDIRLISENDASNSLTVEHIGTSVHTCIEYWDKNDVSDIFDPAIGGNLVRTFLEKVNQQACDICKQGAQSQPIDIESFNQKLEELAANYNEIVDDLKRKNGTDIEKLIKAAEAAALQAETSAKSAASSAKIIDGYINSANKSATDAQTSAQEALKSGEKASASAKRADKLSKKAQNQLDSLIPTVLTILGIFVAIIIAVVACYLSVVLSKSGGKPSGVLKYRPLELTQLLMMGHITLGAIFLLLYLVSKITSHPMVCHCPQFERVPSNTDNDDFRCSECSQKCSSRVRLRMRYPYVYGINLTFAIGYGILGLWQIINVYYRDAFDNFVLALPLPSFFVFLSLASCPAIFIYFFFKKASKKR